MNMKKSRQKDRKIKIEVKKNPPFYTVILNFQDVTKDINNGLFF